MKPLLFLLVFFTATGAVSGIQDWRVEQVRERVAYTKDREAYVSREVLLGRMTRTVTPTPYPERKAGSPTPTETPTPTPRSR